MVSPVAHATQAPPAAAGQTAAVRQAPAPSKAAATPADTVTLSASASLHQELTETSVQTTTEANRGDIQAKNLLTREAAAKKAGL
jgi:hypothetical protein